MAKIASVRRHMSRLFALIAFLGSAGLMSLAAQPPKEVEDPKAKVVKKIVVDDEGTSTKRINIEDDPLMASQRPDAFSNTPPDVRLEEVIRAADQTRTKVLKELLYKYIVPFDRVTESGTTLNVKPIPYIRSKWGGAEVVSLIPLDNEGKQKEQRATKVSDIKKVEHFESLVLEEVEKLQKQKLEGTSAVDQLAAAETLLSAAKRFHDYSRTPRKADNRPLNLRRGEGWDEIRNPLVTKLRSLQLELFNALTAANEEKRLEELGTRLLASYPNDKEIAAAIGKVKLSEAERLLKAGSDADVISARKILDALEASFPGSVGDTGRNLRAQVRELALKALKRSQEKFDLGDKRTARDELARAISFDPDIDGIREMQKKLGLNYSVLYVAARQYPQYMSPATARLDSEKHAVELVFEGLLEEVPDPTGAVHYRPGAALTMPISFPGGRDFLLRTFDKDSSGRPVFDNHDVVNTVTLMRNRMDTWNSYPLSWLSPEPPAPNGTSAVRILFGSAHPDPRAALTFKILPTRWLIEKGEKLDYVFLAERPFGTGPFICKSTQQPDGNIGPREMVFVSNPAYGRWRDRAGLPSIQEVRLVELSKIDPVKAFQEGKLHILTDIPTKDILKYSDAALKGRVDVVTASNNRRVHMLAVNLKDPYLRNKPLRQGLSLAIDREDILRRVYREGKPEFHRQMSGPFPPGSWAVAKGVAGLDSLYDQNLAVVRLKTYLADPAAKKEFNLLYADDDPLAGRACLEIKNQIEGVLKNEARKILIHPQKIPLTELLNQVQEEHARYDLAYVPFDYPDDWYPYALGAMLDPNAAERGGRNWFNFLIPAANPDAADQELGRALANIRAYRDFAGQIMPQTATIGKQFNDCLPFIPLWQLDRHMVVSRRLKIVVDDTSEVIQPRLLNPTILFQGVGRWRLE